MPALILIVVVALAYNALAALSSVLAYAPTDAWSVWLASGLTLGLLLVLPRGKWLAVVAGAAVGAAIFSWSIAPGAVMYAIGYAAVEVVAALAGAWAAGQVGGVPMRLDSPRQLAAVVVGAIVLALVGAGLAAAWSVASGGHDAMTTFAVWALSNIVGVLLVAPVIITWAGFRAKRSGGLPMPQFIRGRRRLCPLPGIAADILRRHFG